MVGRGIESLWSTLERTKLLRDRYPADGVSQLTRSNQWLIRPLQLQIKIVRDPSSCPPPLPASNDSANWTGSQPQTGDLNYYGWKLRPVGSSLVSFARVLFQLRPVSSYLSPSLVSISSISSPTLFTLPLCPLANLGLGESCDRTPVHCMPWCIVGKELSSACDNISNQRKAKTLGVCIPTLFLYQL